MLNVSAAILIYSERVGVKFGWRLVRWCECTVLVRRLGPEIWCVVGAWHSGAIALLWSNTMQRIYCASYF